MRPEEQPTELETLVELYQDVIIDHSQHPHHFCILPSPTHKAEGYNPLCGDSITLYLRVDDNRIKEAGFQGQGCAISTASASLLTDSLIGKTTAEAHRLFDAFHQLMTTGKEPTDATLLGKLVILRGVNHYPARVKCATLAWHTLEAALRHDTQDVTTE